MHRTISRATAIAMLAASPAAAADHHHDGGEHYSAGTAGTPAIPAGSPPASPGQLEGFGDAVRDVFPMTPEMVRQFRRIHEENEEATMEEPFPEPVVDAVLVSLDPGAVPEGLRVAPGIASAIGFYDAAGSPWPVRQYVIGNRDDFRVIHLGENSNSLAISPVARVGWTNLVVVLADEPNPVVLRIVIDRRQAHFHRMVQIMKLGPSSDGLYSHSADSLPKPGDSLMLAFLSGTDLPPEARPVPVTGIEAEAWIMDGEIYLRARDPLLSPAWTASLSGPNNLKAYRLAPASSLLFSVDGRIAVASLELP